MEENLDMIYQLAGKAGIKNLGNFDEFKTRMVKSENQAMLHGLMSKAGVKNLGNLKEFSARITQKKSPGVNESSPISSVPAPVVEKPSKIGLPGEGMTQEEIIAATPTIDIPFGEQKPKVEVPANVNPRVALKEKRKGDFNADAVEIMERGQSGYEKAQNKRRTPLEALFYNTDVTSKEYKAQMLALTEDQDLMESSLNQIDYEISEKFGEAAFEQFNQQVADYKMLKEKYETYAKENNPKANEYVEQLNELAQSIEKFQSDSLLVERDQIVKAANKNLERFQQIQKDDKYKGVREMVDAQKEIQSQVDKQDWMSDVSGVVIGSLAKLVAGASRLTDVVEKSVGLDTKYGAVDKVQDFLIDLGDDASFVFPTPSQFSRQLVSKTAKWGEYEVDFKGDEIQAIRNEDGTVADVKLTDEQEQEIKGLEKKSQFNLAAAPYQAGQVVADMATMLAGAGKITKGLTALGVGEIAATRSGIALATAGQMSNQLYEQGLEQFGGDKQKAAQFSIVGGLLVGMGSNLFGLESRMLNGTKGFLDGAAKANVGAAIGKMPFRQQIAAGAMSMLKEGLGEGFEEALLENATMIGTQYLLSGKVDAPASQDVISEGIMGFAVGSLMGGANVPGELNDIQKSSLLAASRDPVEFEKKLREQVEKSLIQGDDKFIAKQVERVARVGKKVETLREDVKGQNLLEAVGLIDEADAIEQKLDEVKGNEELEARYDAELSDVNSRLSGLFKPAKAAVQTEAPPEVVITKTEPKNLVVHAEEGAGAKAAPTSLPKTIDDIAIKVAIGETVTKAEKETIDQNREAFDARMEEMSEQEKERIKKDVRPLREKFSKISETVEDEIAESFANGARLNTQSYDNASDPTFRKENPSIGLKYLSATGTQIDVWAKELSDKFGIDEQVAQEKIVNFINQNQSGVGDYMRERIESAEPQEEVKQSAKIIEELGEEDTKVLDDFLQRFEVDGKLDEEGLRKAFEEAESGFSPEFLELQTEAPKAYEKLKNLIDGKSKNVRGISGEAKGRRAVSPSASVRQPVSPGTTNQNDSPARRVAGRIGKAFPGIEVVFGTIKNIPSGAKKMGSAGYYHKGKIFLDETLAGSDTPIHEFGHLWQQLLKLQKPHLFKQAAKLAKETDYFKQVQADPEYQNLTEEEQADEAIARAIGDEGKKWLEAPAHKKVWRAIMDALRDLLSAIGYRPSLNVASMTFRDLTKTATREILSRTPITQASSIDVERALSSGFALQFDDSVLEIAPKNQIDKLRSLWNRYLTTTKGIGEAMRNRLERGHNEQRAILNEVKMTSDRFWKAFKKAGGDEQMMKDVADVFSGKAVITILPESIRTELENLMRAGDYFRAKMLDNLVRDGKVVMNEELGMLMTRNFEAEGNLEDALGKIKEEYDRAFEAAEQMDEADIEQEFDRFSIKKKLISLDIAKLRLKQTQALLDRLTARAGDVDARTQKLANKLRDVKALIEKSIEVTERTETDAEKAIGKTTRQVEKDRKAILDKIPEIPEAPMTLDEMDLTAELELAIEDLKEMNQPAGGVNREGLLRLIDKTEAAARHLEERKMSGNETIQVRFKDGEKIELELTQRDGSVEKVELDQNDAEIFFSQLGHDMLRRVQYDKEGYIDIRNPKVFLNNPLYEKIRANKNYVNRSYMKHDVKDFEKNFRKYIGEQHYQEAYNFIQKTYSDKRIAGIRRATAADGSVRYHFVNSLGVETKGDGYVVDDLKDFLRTAGVSEKDINAFNRHEGDGFFRLSAPASRYRRTGVDFFLTNPEIQQIMGQVVSVEDLDSIPQKTQVGKMSVDTGALKKRKDIPEPIRNLMGEYLDPRMTVGRTLIKSAMIAEQTRFNMDFLQDGMGTWISEERTSEHNKKITKANMPHLGEGKEYWTTEEVYDALFANDQIKDRFIRTLVILSGLTKANLTVYKNDSQARNFWGAALNMAATGNWGAFGNLGQAMRVVSQDFTEAQSWGTAMSSPLFVMRLAMGKKFGNKGDQRWVDAYKEAVSYGLVESSAEIGAIEDALNQIDDAAVTRGQKVMKKVKEVTQVFSKPYQMSDAIFKVAAFQAETQRYMEAGFSEQEAKDKAAEIVKNTQPTYGRAARVFRIISRAPLIGNFILFRVEMMRTRANIIKLGMEEIKSGNPTLVKSGITRLTSVSIMAGVSSALALAAKALVGMDDEEEEAIRRDLPDYMDNSDLVWLNNDFANPKYLDFSFIDPTSDFHRAARAALRGEGIGRVLNAGDEMFSGMLGLDIFLKEAGEALVTNQDEYGRKIRNEEDYLLPQAWDVTKHITDPLIPGLAKNVSKIVQAGLISAGVMKEDEIYKLKMTDELMNNFVGVKVKQRDLQNHFSFKMSDFADRIKESEKIPNPGRSEKRRQELFREALNIYNYQPFILSSSEIEDAFKSKSGRITDLWLYRALVAGELPEKKE